MVSSRSDERSTAEASMRPPFTGVLHQATGQTVDERSSGSNLDLQQAPNAEHTPGRSLRRPWPGDQSTLCIHNQVWRATLCIARRGEGGTTDLLLTRLGERTEVWRPDRPSERPICVHHEPRRWY